MSITTRPPSRPTSPPQSPTDRLSETVVPRHPADTFAERLLCAVEVVAKQREAHVVDDGLRGAVVFGWADDASRCLDEVQLAGVTRVVFSLLDRMPRDALTPTCNAALVRPMIDAMPDLELVVTSFAVASVDTTDASLQGVFGRLVAARMRARRC